MHVCIHIYIYIYIYKCVHWPAVGGISAILLNTLVEVFPNRL